MSTARFVNRRKGPLRNILDLVTKEVAGFYRDLTAEQWNMIWKLHDDYVDIGRLMQALQKADKVLFDKMSPIVQSLAPKIQAMPLEAQMYVFRSANDLLIDIVRVNGKKPEENQLKAFGWLVVNRFDHLQDDSKKALRQAVPDYVQVVEGEPSVCPRSATECKQNSLEHYLI